MYAWGEADPVDREQVGVWWLEPGCRASSLE